MLLSQRKTKNDTGIWVNVEAVDAVLNKSRATGAARLVLLVLARHADLTGVCWPGIRTIARQAQVSLRTVQRSLRLLQEYGELDVLPGAGPHGQNLYRLRLVVPGQNKPRENDNESRSYDTLSGGGDISSKAALHENDDGHRSTTAMVQAPKKKVKKKKNTSPLPPPDQSSNQAANHEEEEALRNSKAFKALKDALGSDFDDLEILLREGLSARRWRYWLESVLWPVLQRMGKQKFSAAARFVLPEAAGPGVKYPAKLFISKLLEVERGEIVVVDAPEKVAPSDLGEAGLGSFELDLELRQFVIQNAKRADAEIGPPPAPNPEKTCPHGDHPRSDACCVPRAKETLSWALPYLRKAQRARRRDEEVLLIAQTAMQALVRLKAPGFEQEA